VNFTGEGLRILDFDTENNPGFYWYDGKPTDILHTIACAWLDDPSDNHVWQVRWSARLGLHFPPSSFRAFRRIVESADIVTAHNVVRHDVPLLNAYADRGHLERIRWPRIVDTLTDIKDTGGMPRSQEYLADRDRTSERKMHVGLHTWERAARGEPEAMKIVADRCLSDVFSHIELYRKQYGVQP
jgi:hypothetical protein